jgi:hypothetical protein
VPFMRVEAGHRRRVILHRAPPEAVEHEQHDGVGELGRSPESTSRRPGRTTPARCPRHRRRRALGVPDPRQKARAGTAWPRPDRRRLRPPTREHGRVKVSTRGDYAARALLSLALRGSDGPRRSRRSRSARRCRSRISSRSCCR